MKKLVKNARKNSIYGQKAKRKLKIMGFASLLLLVIGVLCFACGETSGMIIGSVLATAPVFGFTMPDGLELNENEKKGLQALGDSFTQQFNEFVKDKLSEEKMMENLKLVLEKHAEKNGFSEEKLNKLTKSLEEQGEVLTKLKQQIKAKKEMGQGLKAKFFEKFDELKDALSKKQTNYVIKTEPDEVDEVDVQTTASITVSGNASPYEQVREDEELYLKRRDRQYIDDIADVSIVAKIPESITFWEEGDEDGYIAIVDENGLKPQVYNGLIKNSAEAQKAAGWIAVTEEMMKYRTRAWGYIRRLFNDKVLRDFYDKLTENLLTYAAQYISSSLDGTVENPNDFDAIIAVIAQAEAMNFVPDVMVLNSGTKWKIATLKATNGMYLFPMVNQSGEMNILPLRLITSNKIEAGDVLVAESGLWKIEREMPQIRTGLIDKDLIYNRETIVGEIPFVAYVPSNNIGGVISANLDTVKESLDTVKESIPEE